MYHPTPHYWEDASGSTHVFYDNHMPPNTGFGWSSLCDAEQLPIEGDHFELIQDVTESDLTCGRCRNRLSEPYIDPDDDSIAIADGCLVRFDRNEDGAITKAKRVCQGILHHELQFEPTSFTGDLHDEVDDVCSECWETYVDHQWTARDEGAELCVEVRGDDSRSQYFTPSVEAVYSGEAILRLTSKHGLEKHIPHEQIGSISLTPARNINY